MTDKLKHWSEGHNRSADSMHGLGSDMSDESVDQMSARRGVVLLTNCQHCGRQWKGVIIWPEVANYYLHTSLQDTGGRDLVKYTKQGALVLMPCNGCKQSFDVIIDYDELRRWVNTGVRTGCLRPEIYEAARARGLRY